MAFVSLPKGKSAKDIIEESNYNKLQLKFLQASNRYNKYLLQFTNKVFDNVKDFSNPTQEDINEALDKARKEFENMQDALEAEKAYRELKAEYEAQQADKVKEALSLFELK